MFVFRIIIGGLAALLLLFLIDSFSLGIAFDARVWLDRAKRFRQYLWVVALFWFNFEIWGKVIWTIVTWNRPPPMV
jgi:hypothetical protein